MARSVGDVVRLILVGAIGLAAVAFAFATGLPGNGGFLVVAWLAGLAAVLLRPGWGGFLILAGSITVAAVIADMSDGVFGLVALIVAALLVPAAHGALVGDIGRRVVTLGLGQAIRDGRVLVESLVAVILAVFLALAAADLARNPP